MWKVVLFIRHLLTRLYILYGRVVTIGSCKWSVNHVWRMHGQTHGRSYWPTHERTDGWNYMCNSILPTLEWHDKNNCISVMCSVVLEHIDQFYKWMSGRLRSIVGHTTEHFCVQRTHKQLAFPHERTDGWNYMCNSILPTLEWHDKNNCISVMCSVVYWSFARTNRNYSAI
jgi:hypothetical protein